MFTVFASEAVGVSKRAKQSSVRGLSGLLRQQLETLTAFLIVRLAKTD
jgi:hypothetical protein